MNRTRRLAARLVVIALLLTLYQVAKPATSGVGERARLAARLSFSISEIQPAGSPSRRTIRNVHPDLKHIDAWISSVGAAIALGDVDDDGLPNDACLVDPRNDSVSILGLLETGQRYTPFILETPTAGYEPNTIAPMGCLLGDLNEDGQTDALVYYWGRTPVLFLRVDSATNGAAFTPREIYAPRERWFTNAGLLGDFDGDGHTDVLLGNYFKDGDRVLDPAALTAGEMQHSMSRAFNSGSKRLLLGSVAPNGSMTFKDASAALPAAARHGWTLALGARDLDNDLLPEIYIANDFGPDRLLHNRSSPGMPSFTVVEGRRGPFTQRSKVLGRDSFKGMGVDFADINGDGWTDIAVSNIARRFALVESHFLFVHSGDRDALRQGIAPYVDESSPRGTSIGGWSWDVRFADLTNDGRPEILQANGFVRGERNRWPELQELATGNDELLRHPSAWPRFSAGDDLSGHDRDRLLIADESGRYQDVADLVGLGGTTVSRGIATADIDGDGLLDVAIARQWMPSLLLRNRSAHGNKALTLDLRLPAGTGSRPALGATAAITLPNGRRLLGAVDGGSGHSGKRAPDIHIGLGPVASDARLRVQLSWRSADGLHTRDEVFTPGRHRLVLREP